MDNMTGAEKAKEIRNSIFALLIAFIFLFPIYWLIQISFKSDAETFGKVLTYFPHDFTFEPWLENLTDKTFLISLKNSFLNGLLTMAIGTRCPGSIWNGKIQSKRWKCFPSYISDFTDASSIPDIDPNVSDFQ